MFATTFSSSGIATTLGIGAHSLAIGLTLAIVWYILLVIAFWKMFKKFGEPGIKSFIPIYNFYILYKYAWKPSYFWVFFIACFFLGLADSYYATATSQSIGYMSTTFIGYILLIVACVIDIICSYKLSKSFGHGVGYFIGLIFLPSIFYLILGFGRSKYVRSANNSQAC